MLLSLPNNSSCIRANATNMYMHLHQDHSSVSVEKTHSEISLLRESSTSCWKGSGKMTLCHYNVSVYIFIMLNGFIHENGNLQHKSSMHIFAILKIETERHHIISNQMSNFVHHYTSSCEVRKMHHCVNTLSLAVAFY